MVKEKLNYFLGITVCFSLFVLGVMIGKNWESAERRQPQTGIWEEMSAEQNEQGDVEHGAEQETTGEIGNSYKLTEEEEKFLEEHLYGQWRFSERIVEIDENNNFFYNSFPNISDTGVEEIKAVRLLYEDSSVSFTVEIGQNTFTYPQDMYLFAAHGGFSWCRNPIYSINQMDTDTVILKDVYNIFNGYEVQVEGLENYIHVNYYGLLTGKSELYGNIFSHFGSDIYINPDDTDTIYIDFCGLWKMERDDNYYGTNSKCEY